jgi:hypothetical protein
MSQISSTATGASVGAVMTLTGNSGGAVGPDGSQNINVVGAGSITVTGNPGTNTLTISGGDVFGWTDKAVSFNAASNNGYFTTAVVTATMPAAPAQGDRIEFIVDAASVLTVQANTGQVLRIGSVASSAAGTAASSARGDAVTFIYRAADTTWISLAVQGIWTLA